MNASRRRALLSACEGLDPAQPKAPPGVSAEGASAARTVEHLKNPE